MTERSLMSVSVSGAADEERARDAARGTLVSAVRRACHGLPGVKALALVRAERAAALEASERAAKRIAAAEQSLADLDREVVVGHLAAIQGAKAERAAGEAAKAEADAAAERLLAMSKATWGKVNEFIKAATEESVRTLSAELDTRIGGLKERIELAVEKAIAATAEQAKAWATAEVTQEHLARCSAEVSWLIRGEMIGQVPYERSPAQSPAVNLITCVELGGWSAPPSTDEGHATG